VLSEIYQAAEIGDEPITVSGIIDCCIAGIPALTTPKAKQLEITPLLTATAPTVIIWGLITLNELLCATPLTIASSIFKFKV